MPGQLYVISAPSGAGKTSLVKRLLTSVDDIMVSISYTTRPIRPGEEDGVNYYFVDKTAFETMIEEDTFLEYASVFGHYYGTAYQWVAKKLQAGIDVILEIDWQGALQIKQGLPQAVGIFILPPSLAALEQRLIERKQDKPEVIERRISQAQNEIAHCESYDYIVVNDDFEQALRDLQAIIHARRLAIAEQRQHLASLLNKLMTTT